MILLEVGNSTIKLAVTENGGIGEVERYTALPPVLSRIGALGEPVLCAPVGRELSERLAEALADHERLILIDRAMLASFVGDTYDTPGTLGIDRVLNLMGVDDKAVVISCGTAITIDAVIGGVPSWGAIIPGFRTAAEGLHERIPVLPLVLPEVVPTLPARTSVGSVANGVVLGTARAAQALAHELASAVGAPGLPVIVTGGDAQLLARLWSGEPPQVEPDLLFRGMATLGLGNGGLER